VGKSPNRAGNLLPASQHFLPDELVRAVNYSRRDTPHRFRSDGTRSIQTDATGQGPDRHCDRDVSQPGLEKRRAGLLDGRSGQFDPRPTRMDLRPVMGGRRCTEIWKCSSLLLGALQPIFIRKKNRARMGKDLLSFALDGGHQEIIKKPWCSVLPDGRRNGTASTRRAALLSRAFGKAGKKRRNPACLLSKHSAPAPHPKARTCRFLRTADRQQHNVSLFSTLVELRRLIPNTVLAVGVATKIFLALLPNGLRSYLEEDRSVKLCLMLALGSGARSDYLRALIDGGAKPDPPKRPGNKNVRALDVAAETSHWRSGPNSLRRRPRRRINNWRVRDFPGLCKASLSSSGTAKPIYHGAMLHRSVGLLD